MIISTYIYMNINMSNLMNNLHLKIFINFNNYNIKKLLITTIKIKYSFA